MGISSNVLTQSYQTSKPLTRAECPPSGAEGGEGDYCHAVGAVVAVAAHLVEFVPEATLRLTPAAVADACAKDGAAPLGL